MNELRLSPGSQIILAPRFIDAANTVVRGVVRLPNGTFKEFDGALNDSNNPFIRDLMMQHTLEEIGFNTQKELAFHKKKEELDKRLLEDEQREEGLRLLAKAKAEALQLEIFQGDDHKEAKRLIRRAQSLLEVTALAAAALMVKIQEQNKH